MTRELAVVRAEEYRDAMHAGFSALPDMVVVVRDGRVLYVNRAFEKTMRIDLESARAMRLQDFVVGRSAGSVLEALDQAAMEPGTKAAEMTWAPMGAGPLWVKATVRALDCGAQLIVARDVTRRRREEEQVAARERSFRTLLAALDGLVFALDSEGRISELHGDIPRLLPHIEQEVVGQSYLALFGPGEVHRAALAQALTGTTMSYECAVPSASGPDRELEVTLCPMRDSSGDLAGLAGAAREISDRKRVQAQLLITDRLASVGTLAAGVAHEINNPLAAVTVDLAYVAEAVEELSGALGTGELTAAVAAEVRRQLEGVKDALHNGRNASERISRVVKSLLEFSMSPANDEAADVDVRDLLDHALLLAANEIRHRARLLKTYQQVPLVRANRARLGQVFLALLVNAAHAIREGRTEDNEVEVKTRSTPDGRVAIEVRDTGSGIPPEVMRRLFTPFFSTRGVGGGTGLGLSICHSIVTRMGGELLVETKPGMGTTFRVLLPAGSRDLPLRGAAAAPDPMPGSRSKVLIVDDEAMVCASLVRCLSASDVTTKTSAREALAMLEAGVRFDLILCDVLMPHMSGVDLFRVVEQRWPELIPRFVLMTGGAFTPETRDFLNRSAVRRIDKPISLATLRQLAAQALANRDA